MLYVGRLVREKGIEDLLQALAGLSSGLSWRVRIVGDGPLRALVETHAARDHRIEYVPWTREEQLLGEYASAGIFVHPARWPEPFGRTVVEALHAGLPVVVPEEGAAADIAGDAGVTFANSDVASLTHALTALLTDPQKQRELGERGPSRAKRFSKNVVVPELLRILGSVRKSGHGSPQ
jgi:glycosyltransferase involved in cell wall biosynthesis